MFLQDEGSPYRWLVLHRQGAGQELRGLLAKASLTGMYPGEDLPALDSAPRSSRQDYTHRRIYRSTLDLPAGSQEKSRTRYRQGMHSSQPAVGGRDHRQN
jgi:hypothetical protein